MIKLQQIVAVLQRIVNVLQRIVAVLQRIVNVLQRIVAVLQSIVAMLQRIVAVLQRIKIFFSHVPVSEMCLITIIYKWGNEKQLRIPNISHLHLASNDQRYPCSQILCLPLDMPFQSRQ